VSICTGPLNHGVIYLIRAPDQSASDVDVRHGTMVLVRAWCRSDHAKTTHALFDWLPLVGRVSRAD